MRTRWVAVTAALLLLSSTSAMAQRRPTARVYDTTTVETITGTITALDTVATRAGVEGGVHLQLRTPSGTLPVHLGPAWHLGAQATTLAIGDRITASGSRVIVADGPALIAATVRKGSAQLTFRDRAGRPVWSAGAPRRPPRARP